MHIVWPTVIPGDEPVGALFYSLLRDDGTFAPRTRIPTLGSPKPSHPQVVVDDAGRLVVAWDESLAGVRTAAYTVGERQADGSLRFARARPPPRPAGRRSYPVMARLPAACWPRGRLARLAPASSRCGLVARHVASGPMRKVIDDEDFIPPRGGARWRSRWRLAASRARAGPRRPRLTPQHRRRPEADGGLDHMDHRFDDPERYAKEFDDPGRDAWQMPARVIEALKLAPGAKVADIGAGTGYFSMRLAASPAPPEGVCRGPRAVDGGAPYQACGGREARQRRGRAGRGRQSEPAGGRWTSC